MDSTWAAENLQVIRTLMERSAIYRRALAPVMMAVGTLGILGALMSACIPNAMSFAAFWMTVALIGVATAFLFVRRQALKDAEPFWSPPTRRVTQALVPPFFVGCVAGLLFSCPEITGEKVWILPSIWMICYGCGLHAASFYMQRGIRFFGSIFVLTGTLVLVLGLISDKFQTLPAAHYTMGLFFGLGQLAFGIYLYFTEKRKTVV